MMTAESPFIFDVGGDAFEVRVLEASRQTPVLVDFWAEWCGPCRALTPILSALVMQYRGAVLLAKVDTEREQRLALDHGIRSLPTVMLYKDAVVADRFMGLQPESAIRELLDRHVARESDRTRAQAAALARHGDIESAIPLLRKARQDDPDNDRVVPDLAGLLLDNDDPGEAERLIESLPPDKGLMPELRALRARIGFARTAERAPPVERLRRTVEEETGDREARYLLGIRLAAAGDYERAMEYLLEVIERDRHFGDGAARKGMLAIFDVLGPSHALVAEYRPKMARAMF